MRILAAILAAVSVSGLHAEPDSWNSQWVYEISGGSAVLIGYTGPGGRVQLPAIIDGIPVASVGDGLGPVFGGGDRAVEEIVVPVGITRIAPYAFHGSEALSRVSLPQGLVSIGNSAFGACVKLAEMEIPEGTATLGNHAFSGCQRLAKVSFPASLRVVGAYAFADCLRLSEAILPEGVEIVGERAFSGCAGLKSVVLPNSLNAVGNWAFLGTSGLENLSLPARFTAQIGVLGFTGELASRLMAQGVAGILNDLAEKQKAAQQAVEPPATQQEPVAEPAAPAAE